MSLLAISYIMHAMFNVIYFYFYFFLFFRFLAFPSSGNPTGPSIQLSSSSTTFFSPLPSCPSMRPSTSAALAFASSRARWAASEGASIVSSLSSTSSAPSTNDHKSGNSLLSRAKRSGPMTIVSSDSYSVKVRRKKRGTGLTTSRTEI